MQQQVYQVHNVNELKQRLIDVWHGFEQSDINDTVDEWRKRVKEGNFEQAVSSTLYNSYIVLRIIFVNFMII